MPKSNNTTNSKPKETIKQQQNTHIDCLTNKQFGTTDDHHSSDEREKHTDSFCVWFSRLMVYM